MDRSPPTLQSDDVGKAAFEIELGPETEFCRQSRDIGFDAWRVIRRARLGTKSNKLRPFHKPSDSFNDSSNRDCLTATDIDRPMRIFFSQNRQRPSDVGRM